MWHQKDHCYVHEFSNNRNCIHVHNLSHHARNAKIISKVGQLHGGPHKTICRNFIGYDFKYGSDFVHNYSCANFLVVNLIREIRDNSLFVYGFHHNMQ